MDKYRLKEIIMAVSVSDLEPKDKKDVIKIILADYDANQLILTIKEYSK